MNDSHEHPTLINTSEVAKMLGLKPRTVQAKGKAWERNAGERGTVTLSSSPKNGLRRYQPAEGKAIYNRNDIEEYLENSIREPLGQPLLNWRKDGSNDES